MHMRSAVLAAVTGSVLLATSALALPSIAMIWRDPGTGLPGFGATIGTPSVSASSIVIADVVITNDIANPVIGVFISIEFDAGELQAIGATELALVRLGGKNIFTPISLGVILIDNTNGIIEGFDQATLNFGCCLGSETLGSVRFHVRAATGSPGENDVIGSLQGRVDAIGTPSGPGSANFVGATVLPEPTTAALLSGGIAGLVYAGRKHSY